MTIAELENVDDETRYIIEAAAITHDIACPLCREKYGNTNGKHQEVEGELKRSIGTVSQKVLTAQLRDMEDKGLLTRKVYAEVPPRVEYTLTDTGYSLKPVLDFMVAWGTDYQRKNG